MKMEPFQGVHSIAVTFGVSDEYVRQVCNRADRPAPHINVGTKKRQHLKLRCSDFAKWLDDEVFFTDNAPLDY